VVFKKCNFNKAVFNHSSINFEKQKVIECNFKDALFNDCEIFVLDKDNIAKYLPEKIHLNNPMIESSSLLYERISKIAKCRGR
jgi:hypothetical protein